jgi:ribosomal protein L9
MWASRKLVKEVRKLLFISADVPNVGMKGEQVEVKKGFARNLLFRRGLAVLPTPENIKYFEEFAKVSPLSSSSSSSHFFSRTSSDELTNQLRHRISITQNGNGRKPRPRCDRKLQTRR